MIAIAVADIHLSLKPPVARSAEEDWLDAMKRQLIELWELNEKYKCQTIYAGDIFDRHNPPPELINFALKYLPPGYAVPGQHDLPNHRYEDITKSAYWTLVEAEVIKNIPYGEPIMPMTAETMSESAAPFRLHGFPFGIPVEPLEEPNDFLVEIAVMHDYVWSSVSASGYLGAPVEKTSGKLLQRCLGYDVIITGDNHIPFEAKNLFNCGSFFRRRSDEKSHRPSAGLIHADGAVTRHYFDVSADKFLDDEALATAIMKEGDVDGLVEELSKLSDVAIDFAEALRRRVERKDVGKAVGELALEFMEREKQ